MWRTAAVVVCLAGSAHAEIAAEVAKARGLAWKHPVPVVTLDAATFHTRLPPPQAGEAIARWGLVLATPARVAFYDADADQIVAQGGAPELALVPALDRALLRQSFPAFEKPAVGLDGDARRAREALVDGDGLALMIELALARAGKPVPWSDPELAAQIEQHIADPAERAGLAYIAAIRRHRSWRAVDAAFKRPPISTQQLVHRDSRALPIAVTAGLSEPAGPWTIADNDVWGELGVRAFLRAHGVAELAASDVDVGWTGDRELTFVRDDGRALGLWRTEWTTDAAAALAQAAITRAIDDAVVGATTEATADRTSWLGLDGTVAWVERRGTSVFAAVGVPAYTALASPDVAWAMFKRTGTARVP